MDWIHSLVPILFWKIINEIADGNIKKKQTKSEAKLAHLNGFNLATPTKRNVLLGNGYAENGPPTNLSTSSTASSLFTNNSSMSLHSGSSSAMRSPRYQPSSPRNPVTGLGCDTTDSYRGRRRIGRGIPKCSTQLTQLGLCFVFICALWIVWIIGKSQFFAQFHCVSPFFCCWFELIFEQSWIDLFMMCGWVWSLYIVSIGIFDYFLVYPR